MMTMNRTRSDSRPNGSVLCVIFALVGFLAVRWGTVVAQDAPGATRKFTATSMPDVMDELTRRYGYIITLETPRYTYEDDLEKIGKVSADSLKPIYQPKLNPLSLTVPDSSTISTDQMASVLNQWVQKQAASAHGARYRIERDGTVFHLVPTEVRDRNGNWADQKSPFDTPISLSKEDRISYDSLVLVLNAIGAEEHMQFRPFQIPLTIMRNTHSIIEAKDEPARQVLTRILAATGNKLTWRTFYYEPMQSYMVSVFVVPSKSDLSDVKAPADMQPTPKSTGGSPVGPSSAPPPK
jgi:hypothetical protein